MGPLLCPAAQLSAAVWGQHLQGGLFVRCGRGVAFNRSDLGHGAVAGAAHGAAGAVHDLVLAALSGRVVLCVHLRHEPL